VIGTVATGISTVITSSLRLYTYFPTKEDIRFAFYDRFIQTARQRILDREPSETLIDAIQAWVSEDVPAFADEEATIRQRRNVIDGDDNLLAQERLRLALLEDVFAEAFARDLDEDADDLRSRLMASVHRRFTRYLMGLRAVCERRNRFSAALYASCLVTVSATRPGSKPRRTGRRISGSWSSAAGFRHSACRRFRPG